MMPTILAVRALAAAPAIPALAGGGTGLITGVFVRCRRKLSICSGAIPVATTSPDHSNSGSVWSTERLPSLREARAWARDSASCSESRDCIRARRTSGVQPDHAMGELRSATWWQEAESFLAQGSHVTACNASGSGGTHTLDTQTALSLQATPTYTLWWARFSL